MGLISRWLNMARRHIGILLIVNIILATLLVVLLFTADNPTQSSLTGRHKREDRRELSQPTPKKRSVKPSPKPYTFPGGHRTLLPNYRLVGLYGTPAISQLGSLGEQSLEGALQRVKTLATEYQPFSAEPIYPTFEIIASVASASPTENGDYSQEINAAELSPWVDAAKQTGVYIVLDLQPGYSNFLEQAKQYETLLKEPHVGLALDPEWRLGAGQRHMEQIGSVGVDEVNATANWLADLVKRYDLPQKLFLLHQFRLTMLPERERLNTSRSELAYVVQMDGHGTPATKVETWDAIIQNAPPNVHFGWKNFYDEDKPTLSQEATMQINPKPWFISYQ